MRHYDLSDRHPSTQQIMRWLNSGHMPEGTNKDIVDECEDLALCLLGMIGDDPELVVGLRKLVEAKDAFVRANVAQQHPDGA